eukprot:13400180-Alexandrium_andersonii.AAC.1
MRTIKTKQRFSSECPDRAPQYDSVGRRGHPDPPIYTACAAQASEHDGVSWGCPCACARMSRAIAPSPPP